VFLGAPSVPVMVECARAAESCGYESAWMAETRITRDGFVPLAAIGAATRSLQLGTGIVNVFTRGAVASALGFATLEEIAPGRIILGLGTGSPKVLEAQGLTFERPLTRLREHALAIRRLLAGEAVSLHGRTLRLEAAQLEAPPGRRLALYLGVTGPRALALAGEIADGVLLNAFMPVDYVERARERVAAGARTAGRPLAQIDIGAMLVVSVADEGRAARDAVRPLVAAYLQGFPNIARETGTGPALLEDILARGAAAVPDELLARLVVAGTPAECRQRIEAYRAAGVHLPIYTFIGDVQQGIETLAPVVA